MLNGFGPVGFALDQIEDTHFQIRRAMTSNPEHDNGADTRGGDGGVREKLARQGTNVKPD